MAGGTCSAHDQQRDGAQQEFARATIDVRCVVSDMDAAVKFYTQAIGFEEADGFNVPADFATQAGLMDQQPLSIRLLVLGIKPLKMAQHHGRTPNVAVEPALHLPWCEVREPLRLPRRFGV